MSFFVVAKNGFLKSDSGYIHRNAITDLIAAEYDLRELTQREERLQYKTTALKKLAVVDSDKVELK